MALATLQAGSTIHPAYSHLSNKSAKMVEQTAIQSDHEPRNDSRPHLDQHQQYPKTIKDWSPSTTTTPGIIDYPDPLSSNSECLDDDAHQLSKDVHSSAFDEQDSLDYHHLHSRYRTESSNDYFSSLSMRNGGLSPRGSDIGLGDFYGAHGSNRELGSPLTWSPSSIQNEDSGFHTLSHSESGSSGLRASPYVADPHEVHSRNIDVPMQEDEEATIERSAVNPTILNGTPLSVHESQGMQSLHTPSPVSLASRRSPMPFLSTFDASVGIGDIPSPTEMPTPLKSAANVTPQVTLSPAFVDDAQMMRSPAVVHTMARSSMSPSASASPAHSTTGDTSAVHSPYQTPTQHQVQDDLAESSTSSNFALHDIGSRYLLHPDHTSGFADGASYTSQPISGRFYQSYTRQGYRENLSPAVSSAGSYTSAGTGDEHEGASPSLYYPPQSAPLPANSSTESQNDHYHLSPGHPRLARQSLHGYPYYQYQSASHFGRPSAYTPSSGPGSAPETYTEETLTLQQEDALPESPLNATMDAHAANPSHHTGYARDSVTGGFVTTLERSQSSHVYPSTSAPMPSFVNTLNPSGHNASWYQMQTAAGWSWNLPTDEDVRMAALKLDGEQEERANQTAETMTRRSAIMRTRPPSLRGLPISASFTSGSVQHLSTGQVDVQSYRPLATVQRLKVIRSVSQDGWPAFENHGILQPLGSRAAVTVDMDQVASKTIPSVQVPSDRAGRIALAFPDVKISHSTPSLASNDKLPVTPAFSALLGRPRPEPHLTAPPAPLTPQTSGLISKPPVPKRSASAMRFQELPVLGRHPTASPATLLPLALLPTKRSRGRRPIISPELDLDETVESTTASTSVQLKFSGVTKTGKPKKIFVCRVPGCDKCFKRSEHLKRHVRSIHTDEKPHPCSYPGCNKAFGRGDNLKQHMKNLHVGFNPDSSEEPN